MDPAFRRLLLFGLVGLVVASTLIAGFELRPAGIFPVNGQLVVEITDAPPGSGVSDRPCGDCGVTSLNVTIDSIRIHRTGALNLTGEWVEVLNSTQPTRTFDITLLKNMTEVLGTISVPQSMITSVRLHVTSATAKLTGSGDLVSLEVPSGELKMALGSVQVRAGTTTTMVIDFQPHVVCQGNDRCKLTPVLALKSARGTT